VHYYYIIQSHSAGSMSIPLSSTHIRRVKRPQTKTVPSELLSK